MPPAYQRIANELRKRIASGRLSPGDALPSVRVVSRTWKVAPATAAHALRTLVQEGWARSVPRSGIRVVGPVDRRAGSDLSRARILSAAIRMADRVGIAGLSVRALAEELNAPTMSLYRHIEGKDHLVALMVDAAFGEEPMPDVTGLGWRKGLEVATRQEWRAMRRHPWLAGAVHISRPGTQPNALLFADRVMQALERTSLNAAQKLELHVLLHSFVQGMAVNVEAEAHARRETGIDEEEYMRGQEAQFQAVAASGELPWFARMLREMPEDFRIDLDALFERGLDAMLSGFAPRLRPGRTRRRPGQRRRG